jgi:hypothetical protein
MEDARDEPAGTRHQDPAGSIAMRVGRRSSGTPSSKAGARARTARVRGRRSPRDRPGSRRRGRRCRTSRSSRARARPARAPSDGVAPRVDGAELRPDVEMDAAWRSRPVRAATRFDGGRDLGLGPYRTWRCPAPTARPVSVSAATSGLSR